MLSLSNRPPRITGVTNQVRLDPSKWAAKSYDRCVAIAANIGRQNHFESELQRKYQKAPKNFVSASLRLVDGPINKSLEVVRFHGEKNSHAWWMSVKDANRCQTLEEIRQLFALSSLWSDITYASYAMIPKGARVKCLKGVAAPQWDAKTNQMLPGGGRQYCFAKFEKSWVKETRRLPKNKLAEPIPIKSFS